jgi:hypothetical protein
MLEFQAVQQNNGGYCATIYNNSISFYISLIDLETQPLGQRCSLMKCQSYMLLNCFGVTLLQHIHVRVSRNSEPPK